MTDTPPGHPADDDVPAVSWLLGRLVIALAVLGVGAWFASTVLEGPIERVSAAFVNEFGLIGVGLGVLTLDAIPGTFHEPLLILAYDGGIRFWTLVFVAGTASWGSGVIGWTCGRLLRRAPFLVRALERYRIGPFMRRYGGRAIALAALTPFPYAITTWGAGATDVPLSTLMLGALVRYVKVALYLGILVYGWTLGQ